MTGIILCFLCILTGVICICYEMPFFGILFIGIGSSILTLYLSNEIIKEKGIKDYLNGKVEVKYEGYQKDSTFIITDTVFVFK